MEHGHNRRVLPDPLGERRWAGLSADKQNLGRTQTKKLILCEKLFFDCSIVIKFERMSEDEERKKLLNGKFI